MNRAAMYIEGAPVDEELGSIRDSLLQALWVRRTQARIFETLVNVLANGLSLNPDLSKNIDSLTQDYIDIVIPGSKASKKMSDKEFAERTNKALNEVAALLAGGGSGKIPKELLQ